MSEQVLEELQITGSLLSFNMFEEKLMRNFYIIGTKLKKLDEINQLDTKIKSLEKEFKFLSMKMETMSEKIPKQGATLARNDVKMIAKDTIFDVLNSKDDRLMATKYSEEMKKQIESIKVELAKIRLGNPTMLQKKDSASFPHKASFTAGQVLLQESTNKKIPKESLQQCLDNSQLNIVNDIVGSNEGQKSFADEVNEKFEDIYKRIEEIRLGKMFNDYGEKDIEKFERYEQYEQKSQQATRRNKEKPMRLDGIKRQNVKGELLKNDLYAEYQKSELLKAQFNKNSDKKNLLGKGSNTMTTFKEDKRTDIRIFEDGDEKMRRTKSIKKLQRIQRRLKVDDVKELNSVLKEIQLRIQSKVSHEIFMGFVQDIEEKIQILRVTKDATNDISELRKMVYSIQSRLQAIIIFLQNSVNQDDALFVKKQWTCISCDKNLEKYSGKVGQHLNWQGINPKKLSPSKVGAFGQTGQLANKIRSIMENQKGGGQQ